MGARRFFEVDNGRLLIPFVKAICVDIRPANRLMSRPPDGLEDPPAPQGMKFHLLTIFPGVLRGPFRHGVVARAAQAGALEIHLHDLRTWTTTCTARWMIALRRRRRHAT